jgi:hypothetical protein
MKILKRFALVSLAVAFCLSIVVVSADAQRRYRNWDNDRNNGNRYGWERGRRNGWDNGRKLGWRNRNRNRYVYYSTYPRYNYYPRTTRYVYYPQTYRVYRRSRYNRNYYNNNDYPNRRERRRYYRNNRVYYVYR